MLGLSQNKMLVCATLTVIFYTTQKQIIASKIVFYYIYFYHVLKKFGTTD